MRHWTRQEKEKVGKFGIYSITLEELVNRLWLQFQIGIVQNLVRVLAPRFFGWLAGFAVWRFKRAASSTLSSLIGLENIDLFFLLDLCSRCFHLPLFLNDSVV
jgi:hypothetical protein